MNNIDSKFGFDEYGNPCDFIEDGILYIYQGKSYGIDHWVGIP